MKIVVAHDGGLGSLVLLLPTLGDIRAAQPAAEVVLVSSYGALAVACDKASRVARIPFWASGPSAAPSAALAKELSDADLVLTLLSSRRGYEAAFNAATKGASSHSPSQPAAGVRVAQFYRQALKGLGIAAGTGDPAIAFAGITASGPPAICPVASNPFKSWPRKKWVSALLDITAPAVLFGLPASPAYEAEQAVKLPAEIKLFSSPAVVEFARALAACRFFVGHDSGPMHLAAALGIPGVAIRDRCGGDEWAPNSAAIATLPMGTLAADIADLVNTHGRE